MSAQMADPNVGMVSFQQALRQGILQLAPVKGHSDLYSHFDVPAPGVGRLTYVRLDKARNVKAFVACIMNGTVDGYPCVSLGYAVPEDMRAQGLAKQIVEDVIHDTLLQVGKTGARVVYIEAITDVENVASQRVAEATLEAERESITDGESGRPAYRYTQRYDIPGRC
ncbi:RimJ/RimL family protein N-acetyltransferase [Massilia sp. UYP32]